MDIIINEDCEIYYDRITVGDKHYTTIGLTPVRRLVINGFAKCLTQCIYVVADEIIMPHTDCEIICVNCKNITIESTRENGMVGHDDSIEINLTSNTMTKHEKYVYYVNAMYNIYKSDHMYYTVDEYLETFDDCMNIDGVNIYVRYDPEPSDCYGFIKDNDVYEFSTPSDSREYVMEMLPEFVNKIIKK